MALTQYAPGILQAAIGAPLADSGLRVVHTVQVGDQARPRWRPVQLLLSTCARGRQITAGEAGKPAKVRLRLLGLNADYRYLQPAAQRLGDGLHRHALLVHRVVDRARLRLL